MNEYNPQETIDKFIRIQEHRDRLAECVNRDQKRIAELEAERDGLREQLAETEEKLDFQNRWNMAIQTMGKGFIEAQPDHIGGEYEGHAGDAFMNLGRWLKQKNEQLATVTALADNRAIVITARNQEKIAAEQQRDALAEALELAVVEAGKFLSDKTKAQVDAALKAAGRTGE